MLATSDSGTTTGDHPAADQPAATGRLGRLRSWLGALAAWVGLANLIYVLGSNIYRQWSAFPDWTGGADPLGGARDTAITGAVAGVLALLSGRMRWPSILVAALFGLWAAFESLTIFVLSGTVDPRPLWLAATGAGLALGTAAAKPSWSGWSIFILGCGYVFLNLYVLFRNYATVGADFTGAAIWWGVNGWTGELPARPDGVPPPGLGSGWLLGVLSGRTEGFAFGGIATNGNLTSNYAAFLIVFTVPFILGRWRSAHQHHPVAVPLARGALIAASAVPGVVLLLAATAHTATIGVLLGWAALLIPLGWSRNRVAAAAAAVIAPMAVLVPPMLARAGLLTASGRDCVWDSWRVGISDSLRWGVGQTGGFPGVTCDFPWWSHAHNELLQAWWTAGFLGLLSAAGLLAALAWFAVRHSNRDQRTLLSLVICACVLLGFEIITTGPLAWIGLGLASFIAISARSVQLVTGADEARDVARTEP